MSQLEDIESRLAKMKQKLAVMEWDVQRNQINPAKRVKYDKLREECRHLEEEWNSLKQSTQPVNL